MGRDDVVVSRMLRLGTAPRNTGNTPRCVWPKYLFTQHAQNRHRTPHVADQAGHATPYGPLQRNVTSSIKPEIHNTRQLRRRKTEPRLQEICVHPCRSVQQFQRYARGHTDRRTDKQTNSQTAGLITISRTATRAEYLLYIHVHVCYRLRAY